MRGILTPLGAASVAVALLAAPGCGPGRADVSGTVSYKGKPVVYGTVSVVGTDQMTYYGVIQQDGTFTVPGVPVGAVKLGVFSPDPYFEPPIAAAEKARYEEARLTTGVPLPPKPPKGKWFRLPGKYSDPVSSGLTAEHEGQAGVNLRLE